MLPDKGELHVEGQLVGYGHNKTTYAIVTFYALNGKVYSKDNAGTIHEVGCYFQFMKDMREKKYEEKFELVEATNLTSKVYDLMNKHITLASKYEAEGNTQGSMYLRYVGNMLAALLRGQEVTTILPE